MYDPVIGRVLSPDNYVQDPTNTQSYNRYSYCLNNPLRYTDPSGWFAAAADQYWNMGKDITDFISFSGRRASSLDGAGGGGQGWGGNGGVLPAWYGGGDYGDFWRQMYSSVNHLCNSNVTDGVYSLSNIDFSNGTFKFSFNYLTQATIELNRDIAIYQKVKAFYEKMSQAAASNIGYGKSFVDPTDPPAGQEGNYLGSTNKLLNGAGYVSGGIGAAQIGMFEYRCSLSLSSKIGTFSKFSTTYKFLGFTQKLLGHASTYVGAPISIYCDYQALKSDKIGVIRFTYRQIGLGSSIATGFAIAGPWGAAGGATVAGGFWVGEQLYNGVTFAIDMISQFSSDFNNAVSSGSWHPGL